MVKKPTTAEELARANEKSKKRKESRDKMLADKLEARLVQHPAAAAVTPATAAPAPPAH